MRGARSRRTSAGIASGRPRRHPRARAEHGADTLAGEPHTDHITAEAITAELADPRRELIIGTITHATSPYTSTQGLGPILHCEGPSVTSPETALSPRVATTLTLVP